MIAAPASNQKNAFFSSKLALIAPLALGTVALLGGPQAMASVQVNVNGHNYTIVSFLGNYLDNTAAFGVGSMPWWGNNSLASEFAQTVAASLGTPNPVGFPITNLGPYFASETFQVGGNIVTGGLVWDQPVLGSGVVLNCTSTSVICSSGLAPVTTNAYYATATTAAVPGPLPVLGAVGALGWCRRLRARLRQSRLNA
jgi:hypothetical protein